MNSLDPRIQRLEKFSGGVLTPKVPLDQFGTFEVFVQPKVGKPFQHEGIVHAPNLEMGYILAKETFTRRFTCVSLFIVETRDVLVSPMTEGTINVYDLTEDLTSGDGQSGKYEIFHLSKRGKQHLHVGSVEAANPSAAFAKAKEQFNTGKTVYNVWLVSSANIRFTSTQEGDLWTTLPEKKFRDAADYKGGEKLKTFLEANR